MKGRGALCTYQVPCSPPLKVEVMPAIEHLLPIAGELALDLNTVRAAYISHARCDPGNQEKLTTSSACRPSDRIGPPAYLHPSVQSPAASHTFGYTWGKVEVWSGAARMDFAQSAGLSIFLQRKSAFAVPSRRRVCNYMLMRASGSIRTASDSGGLYWRDLLEANMI
jgi:hypothetical protein